MRSMSIDIETYSSVDLAKSGVYRYCESPDFEILLFGYSVDGGTVEVIDLANGEKIPEEILEALIDESVVKWAFNANYERVTLSRYLHNLGKSLDKFHDRHPMSVECARFLNPRSWRCTMVWSAYMGLPLSLEGVGTVLKLDKQKLTEGKELIRYFCVPCSPTGVNGGRTRNLPSHAPEKWERFKAYNKRDVETEMSIQTRLAKFPVPEFVWEEYHLDQVINDRGVRLDMDLVKRAIEMDEHSRAELTEAMRRLTDFENPNSVTQMKRWLSDNGLETDTLGKKAVAELLKTAPEPLRDVLTLRRQLAKSSVRKYATMENAVCSDGRARGMFRFYGANRSGRWCLTGDHEILTENGWLRFDEWSGGKIACWNPYGETISFQNAASLSFPYSGKMYEYSDKRIAQISTPDHKMYVKRRYDAGWETDTVENMQSYRPSIPFTGYRYTVSGLEQEKLRVLIMVQADGCFAEDGSVRLGFTKQRKAERCKRLLRSAGISFVYKVYENNPKPRHQYKIFSRDIPMWLRLFRNKTFGTWLFNESADVFFDELAYWDGYRSGPNSIQYTTCNKQNADIIQAFAHLSGRAAQMKVKDRREQHPNWNTAYVLDIWLTPKNCHEIRTKAKSMDFNGTVYCAETSTGFFLVRRNGKVWVTGNSGRLIQLQNLPKNQLPDLEQARALVKDGNYDAVKMLYDDVPDTLSQLIRTAFIPRENAKFIVADFSAIEARVIAWLAGEKWRQKVFDNGGDIYCASASQMFKVPVEKHGVNGHLRQKGKIAELALGYGGSVGALKAMGALEMGLKEYELKPLVDAWRSSNPNIVRLWWDVDRAVTAAVRNKSAESTHGLSFIYRGGMLFIELPSGRRLAYVRPRVEENSFGGECVTYEGAGAGKKWGRIETFGGKMVENIVQATARDILVYAMKTLRYCNIVMHVHDEIIIEADKRMSVEAVCEQMSRTPPWAEGLRLRADGYETVFYKKD